MRLLPRAMIRATTRATIRSIPRRWLVAWLLAPLLAGTAAAQLQPLTLASDPAFIAKAALGAERGTLVVGTLRNGKPAYGAAYNPEPPSAPRAIEPSSAEQPMFEIGSITKVFTGLLLAQAVERGDLKLDDTVGKLLAGKVEGLSAPVASVTLRQLVTHTGCMPVMADGVGGGAPLAEQFRSFDKPMFWAALARIKLTAAAPPCEGAYSNFGMALLGQLLAEHYGTSWGELVRARITEPLGMNDTVITLGDKASRMAPAFAGDRRQPLFDMQAYAPASALRSTAADMMTFSRAIIAGAGGPLGPAAARMLTPLAHYEGAWIGYAVMVRGPEGGRRTYWHAGLTEGYRTLWLIAPDTNEAIVVLSSNARAPLQPVMLAIGKSRYPVPTTEVPIDPQRLDDYRGEFRINKTKALSFTVRGSKLLVRETGRGYNALTPTGTDRFAVVGIGAQFVFRRDAANAVVAVSLTQGGSQLDARREGVAAAAVPLQQ
ncbi:MULTISPECIES: serine hydrolase domain-containing protein [Variovorax]|jgi:CubicO group peptidase (beta-lactamase class C family)|uniref:serine hydrolase domain-containing protein n=1 Tax=Variovorax TaxID=34072 RepID=UPI00086EFBEA|nr:MULTISPECIES: serine hydrolase domain-containing protein [Variovorax]MBN8753769.1 beta-lactamase family protein [Variovorax sp.]ODU17224.1 MAG: serine hydrolase [Variovorax sp. SCN 67-85]ODV17866.1 MAG: serine hydrolase [Variovorax sp. SCN 67-20]OJZ02601.1 MAG: serine hydrolase [Variovorax sp. 67-131]UKI10933.1 beta-lactamase family protein [Variovorax paradoxus]